MRGQSDVTTTRTALALALALLLVCAAHRVSGAATAAAANAAANATSATVEHIGDNDQHHDDEQDFHDAETDVFFDAKTHNFEAHSGPPNRGHHHHHHHHHHHLVEEEIFYDSPEEVEYSEGDEENSCASSSRADCFQCCTHQGFDLPLWNTTVGQCFCYASDGDENICREARGSPRACHACCLARNYRDSDCPRNEHNLIDREAACFCSRPIFEAFFSTVKSSLKEAGFL